MVVGDLARIAGVDCYRIEGVDEMDPFLMSVVSSSDLWMFISSRGTLTAGRIDADHAFLPYETDDRIHRAVGTAGPVTVIVRNIDGRRQVWRPLDTRRDWPIQRSLSKAVLGDRVVFDETNLEWGLTYRATWMPAPSYGWVRRVELSDKSGAGAHVEILDGLLDVMPAGVDANVEQVRSNLVDAYKRSETGRWNTAAIYSLESLVSDRAEPGEALSANIVWSFGDVLPELHLDDRALDAFVEGREWASVDLLTGRRGAYLRRGTRQIGPGETASWSLVAEVDLDHAQLVDNLWFAGREDADDAVERDVAAGSVRLRSLMMSADAFQHTGDPVADAHHVSNVLSNTMRGGMFPHGHLIPIADLLGHLKRWNRGVHHRHELAITERGELLDVDTLRAVALDSGDPDLIRLVLEYLPLAFSRRHGDPSRPWNRFAIRVRGEAGEEVIGYEGNWRDIFQNWEALMISHPSFLPHAVAKFVNASTVDGYNPYRITDQGVDWEVPEAEDPWSNIGYWGDHQIVYLHRLVELWNRVAPDAVSSWLDRSVFTYADVPYVIADRAAMVRDPRNTIRYDDARAGSVDARVSRLGNDGRLVVDAAGEIVRVGLFEKLVVPVLAKLTNLVPGGGIWMNTQRPEWNDANNALAGFGVSMVTLYHLHGYITWLQGVAKNFPRPSVAFSGAVADWLILLRDELERFEERESHIGDAERRAVMDALGSVGDNYRRRCRESFEAEPTEVAILDIERLCAVALAQIERSLESAQGADGLFESYHLVSFPSATQARVEPLGPMLEGQVAVLSSGLLDAEQALALVEAVYRSDMYRPDQDSFMLYPAPRLPSFVDRNKIPREAASVSILGDIVGVNGIVSRDRDGDLRFGPGMVNSAALESALADVVIDRDQQTAILDVYESVFEHHRYTGRSGSMYGYEGIGTIYWHMIGKLLLAIQETYWKALDSEESSDVVVRLGEMYRRVRAGLGFCKSPSDYGAIPIDCYSHTPAHAGAQQPGMTGQVKEEILTRLGELGLRLGGGRISLSPGLLRPNEMVAAGDGGCEFHFCGVRFSIGLGGDEQVQLRRSGRWDQPTLGLSLSDEESHEILGRRGTVDEVRFTIVGERS